MKTLHIILSSISTIILVLTFVVSGLANYPDLEEIGFKNTTGDISNEFYTQITPAGWTFSIWGVIYTWQAFWIIYGWSLVFRSSFPLTISPCCMILFSCANIGNIIWIYVWGNAFPQYAFPVVLITGLLLYIAIGFEVVQLYKKTAILKDIQKYKIDLYLTRSLVLNGIVIYATWVTLATLLNFTVVLQHYADVSASIAGTISLSLLTVEVIVYFILENTVLDSFARPVVLVYPVVIWALSGAINAHWGKEDDNRNNIFSLILLIVAIILFIVRIVLIIVFAFVRPIKYPVVQDKNNIIYVR